MRKVITTVPKLETILETATRVYNPTGAAEVGYMNNPPTIQREYGTAN